jgi:hypothetical protein
MELLGIVLSIPVAFVTSMLYCLFLARVLSKFERPSRWLRVASRIVLVSFAAELILLITQGSVRSRGLLGPGFYVAHVVLFFLGPPALANLLVLRPRPGLLGTWYVAGAICTAFAFFLVLLQYTVSESLFGIDGENGPYSMIVTHPPTCAAESSKPLPSPLPCP